MFMNSENPFQAMIDAGHKEAATVLVNAFICGHNIWETCAALRMAHVSGLGDYKAYLDGSFFADYQDPVQGFYYHDEEMFKHLKELAWETVEGIKCS